MSNYTKTTDFQAKDSLPAGDSNKVIRGSEFETEFDNIATAVNSKADTAGPTFTGTLTFATISDGTINVTAFVDEDNMASNSATLVPTQQSVKAYVDSQITANNELSEVLSNGNTTGGTDIAVGTGDDITFVDNSKAIFGAGSDLQIYHDGTHSKIEDAGTGDLKFITNGSGFNFQKGSTENLANFAIDGAVTLYYDNAAKFATTSTGIDVTGTVTADSATIGSDGAIYDLILESNAPILRLSDTSASTAHFLTSNNAELRVQGDSSISLRTDNKKRLDIGSSGDISFYEDTGTTPKLFWDASTERLGLGTSSPTATLDVDGTIKLDGNYPTGTGNVALGDQALDSIASGGNYNVAIGSATLTGITTGGYNVGIGGLVAPNATTANYNVGIGMQALDALTTGYSNIAIGNSALSDITTQNNNVAIGPSALQNATANSNTAVGSSALRNNTTGSNSTAIGYNSLYSNTTGIHNVAVGASALDANTTASNNIAVGNSSLGAATTGSENVAVGKSAASTMTTASGNVALGFAALQYSTASNNVAIGKQAMQNSTSGTQNVAIGAFALDAVNTGSYHTAVGYGTLGANTSGASNTALGYYALNANTTASNNTAVGYYALKDTTTGQRSVAVGSQALAALEDGNENVAVGQQAMKLETSGQRSVAVGYYALALQNNTDAGTNAYNTAVGALAGQAVTTGKYNTFIGGLAGDAVTTGANNVALGYQALTTATTAGQTVALGQSAGRYTTTGSSNVYIGYDAGQAGTTAQQNVAIGRQALNSNTTSANNTAVGYRSLQANTAAQNTAVGQDSFYTNTSGTGGAALGFMAGYSNTTGSSNTALGYQSLLSNTTASDNTAVGYHALYSNTTGTFNTVVGSRALDALTTGIANVAVGYKALSAATTSSNNIAVGYQALNLNTTGANNVAVGSAALDANTSGSNNVAIGKDAMTSATTSGNNVAVGTSALATTTTNGANVAIGRQALYANTAGNNTAVGYQALYANTTGADNVAIGKNTLDANTTGYQNIAMGNGALGAVTTGANNVGIGLAGSSITTANGNIAIGRNALISNVTSNYNLAIGYDALRNSTADTNTAVGHFSLDANTTGQNNTAVGYGSGGDLTTGIRNTFIGHNAGNAITTGTKNTILGRYNGNQGGLDIRTSNNHIVLSDGDGNPRVVVDDSGNTGIGSVSPSAKLDLSGTNRVQLRTDDSFPEVRSMNTTGSAFKELGLNGLDLRFLISNTEKARLDSSGNLLVGTTDTNVSDNTTGAGININGDGEIKAAKNGTVLNLNRLTTDGEIIRFKKGGTTTVGSIGTASSGNFYIEGSGDHSGFEFGTNVVVPFKQGAATDGVCNLGGPLNRFKDLYLSEDIFLSNGSLLKFKDSGGTDRTILTFDSNNDVVYAPASAGVNNHIWKRNGSEKMRLDTSGNLLVGTTLTPASLAATTSEEGVAIGGDGLVTIANSGQAPLALNRLSSDGNIITLDKDGSTVGSIAYQSHGLQVNGETDHSGISFDAFAWVPLRNATRADNTVSLGTSTYRFKDLYLSGGAYLGGVAAANKLDDYEEGTFTPTLAIDGGTGSFTYGSQTGTYTKIGDTVLYQIRLTWTAAMSGSGSVRLILPFMPTQAGDVTTQTIDYISGITNAVYLEASGITAGAYLFDSANAFISGSNVQSSGEIRVTLLVR